MSAFVAFNGFPGQSVQDPIGTLLLQEPQAQVSVPVKHVHVGVLATRRSLAAGARHRREAARKSQAPKASTGPVVHRRPSTTQTPTRTQAPAPAPSQGTVPVAQTTPPVVPGTAPSLPDTGLPLPAVTLPTLPPPPPPGGSSQLPIDTSGVTSLLGG